VRHVIVSANGMLASRPLLRNHACACHGICCGRLRSHHDGWYSTKSIAWVRSKPACHLIYVCVCSLFLFVTIKVTTLWMPCSYLHVLISIEMYVYACALAS
jgi:hypothetical protein